MNRQQQMNKYIDLQKQMKAQFQDWQLQIDAIAEAVEEAETTPVATQDRPSIINLVSSDEIINDYPALNELIAKYLDWQNRSGVFYLEDDVNTLVETYDGDGH